jgi:hypothetical protein
MMPKKYTEVQKRQWLKQFEAGRSEAWIANNFNKSLPDKGKCDVRTVRKAIQEARRGDQIRAAEAHLLETRLLQHQERLLETIQAITGLLVLPPALELKPAEGSWIMEKNNQLSYYMLLKDHLDNSTLSALLKWEKCYQAHFEARKELQKILYESLQEKTGLEFSDGSSRPPYLYQESIPTIAMFMINYLLPSPDQKGRGESSFKPDLNQEISLDAQSGRVNLRNVIIVDSPGQEKGYYKKILEAITASKNSEAAKQVYESGKSLEEAIAKVDPTLRELLLSGMVTGRCRICRRLGLD